MSNTKPKMLKKGDALNSSDSSRLWGTITCIGNYEGGVLANFNPADGSEYHTVNVPPLVHGLVLIALQDKLTTLISFSGPFGPYVTITDIIIYN